LESFIERYGEEEGERRYIEKNENHSFAMTLAGFIQRYGEEEGEKRYFNNVNSRIGTLEGFIERHGEEEGTKKYNKHCKDTTHNISNYKKWYGDEWENKWNSYILKLTQPVSKESIDFFNPIYSWLIELGVKNEEIYWGVENSKEYFLKNDENFYFFDFTILKAKVMIEYNGTHVHPKPELSEEERNKWKHAFSKEGYFEVLEKQNLKRKTAEDKGFTLIEVWSDDDKEQKIEEIKEKLNEYITKR
jgi:very-short-patch-repair endonuclease